MFLFYVTATNYSRISYSHIININKLIQWDNNNRANGNDNDIDTVYVCFACKVKDHKYDCLNPSDMLSLKYIFRIRSCHVVGWRLHHHHRNEFDRALANAIMKSNDEM